MWLAKDVSIQWMLSTHYWQHQLLWHTAGFAAGNHISSADKETGSRGWGYSWIKATDLIRSVQGSVVSEMPQGQGILKVQEAVRSWLWAQLSLCPTVALSHHTIVPTVSSGDSMLAHGKEACCTSTVTHKQACRVLLLTHMYFLTLSYTGPQLPTPRQCFSEKSFCRRNFITDCKLKFLVASTTTAWPIPSDIGSSGVRKILLLVLIYIKNNIVLYVTTKVCIITMKYVLVHVQAYMQYYLCTHT